MVHFCRLADGDEHSQSEHRAIGTYVANYLDVSKLLRKLGVIKNFYRSGFDGIPKE